MLGAPDRSHVSSVAWGRLERRLGVPLPDDYKTLVDAYGPIQLNGHLYLCHPGTARWNLSDWMESTVSNFQEIDLSDAECPGFPSGPVFGVANGLIPLADTDRGEYVFGVVGGGSDAWRLLVCDGEEPDFYEYRMPFSEWLFRYFEGEDMFGPDSAVFYPGPVVLESLPLSEGERVIVRSGPSRGH
ncbi:SMI1/KNR4 family protein [Streptomyces sp. NPDC051214]|uniref:SMI1/KNR4 family protein n=1 Tax=Streptomyces sp. NPDC051214 TaxID=3155282 RepID=UPI003414DE4B